MRSWIFGALVQVILMGTAAMGAGVSVDKDYGWQNGVGVSSMPLVQKTASAVSVRLVNSGSLDQLTPVTLLGSDNKTTISRIEVTVPANGSTVASVPWTPKSNGWKRITVVVGGERLSAEVPVSVRRLYFTWYNNDPKFDRNLVYPNVVLSSDTESHKYWESRGAIPCLWKGAKSTLSVKTPEEYASYLGDGTVGSGTKGILIDEMGGYSECDATEDSYYRGLDQFTQKRDDLFVGLWVCGSLRYPFCNITQNIYRKKGVNLLMLEGYLNFIEPELQAIDRYAYFDQRIQVARNQDVMGNTVMVLCVVGHEKDYPVTGSDLEDQVIYLRTHAPEMPGMGFFATAGAKRETLLYADALCRKYYIDPVLAVWDRDVRVSNVTPKAGESVRVTTDVYNIGGMDAKGVVVCFYDKDTKIGQCKLSIPAGGGIPTGRAAAVLDWKPSSGWHDLRVEIIPPRDVSVVSGVAQRRFFVR